MAQVRFAEDQQIALTEQMVVILMVPVVVVELKLPAVMVERLGQVHLPVVHPEFWAMVVKEVSGKLLLAAAAAVDFTAAAAAEMMVVVQAQTAAAAAVLGQV